MFSTRSKLLALTALSLCSATSAQAAATIYPVAEIKGNGASSIANVLVQELNCFGGANQDLAVTTADAISPPNTNVEPAVDVPEASYTPAKVTVANPNYNCNTQSVQPNVTGEYVSTGSGSGRFGWANFNDIRTHDNDSSKGVPAGTLNTHEQQDGDEWGHVQFAFSDAPISSGELTTYNSVARDTNKTGAAIQVPLYVLPVAISYDPIYGVKNTGAGSQSLSFNVKASLARPTGGLRVSRQLLCGIFSGTVTNFNDALFTTANGNTSLKDPNDDQTRWTSTGVPIVLVGRQESSGTTNIFTRALAAQCPSGSGYTAGTNTLPAVRVGSARYDTATGNLITGAETPGVFGLVPNSEGVANTVDRTLAAPATIGDVALNGRLGYIGSDFVLPSPTATNGLFSADLQIGTSTKYAAPTAVNALTAYKLIVPPQSDAKGKFVAANTANGLRSDPLAWVQPVAASAPIANPSAGYPIVGTTNALLYTCYATPAVRTAMVGFTAFHLGKFGGTDSTGGKFPAALVTSAGKAADGNPVGIDPRSGISIVPPAFVTAIVSTFLTNTLKATDNPGTLNLFIQNKLPAKTADLSTLQSNSSCSTGLGA